MKTRMIKGNDADVLYDILHRHGITLADGECHVRFFRKRDIGKRLFIQLTPLPQSERIDKPPDAE